MRTLLLLAILAAAPVATADDATHGPANDDANVTATDAALSPDPPPGSPCRPHCALL